MESIIYFIKAVTAGFYLLAFIVSMLAAFYVVVLWIHGGEERQRAKELFAMQVSILKGNAAILPANLSFISGIVFLIINTALITWLFVNPVTYTMIMAFNVIVHIPSIAAGFKNKQHQ